MIMPILELVRLEESPEGTFGVLRIQKRVFCVTLEPQDLQNVRDRSSIPAQQYLCRRHRSQRFGETFMVTDVPGRKDILFHPGNTEADTAGCILVAEHYGKLRGNRAVLNSGVTFGRFMEALAGHDTAHLTVYERF